MADDALKFQVQLAGNLVSELVASGRAANTAEGGVQALTGAILGLTEASKKKETSFFVFDLAKGAEMAIGWVETLASSVYNLGRRIIGAVTDTQDLGVALRQNVGVDGKREIESIASSFGDTRFGAHRLERELLPLLNVGMGEDKALLQDIVTAATDIAARTGDSGATAGVLEAFKRVHTRREVNARMLMSLGLNEKDFYTALGETLGRSAKGAEAQVKAGQVRAATLEAELLGLIAKREGGSLGKATDESAKTLGTTLERLQRIPTSIFNELANSPGLKQMQDRADQFIDTMGGAGKERIVNAIGSALNRIGNDLFGDEKAADKFITAFEQKLPKVIDLIEKLGGFLAGVLDTVLQLSDKGDRAWNILSHAAAGAAGGAAAGALFGGVGAVPGAAIGAIGGAIDASLQNGASEKRYGTHGVSGGWGDDIPQAHDFIWRNGQAVQLDPDDTVMGAKGAGLAAMGGTTTIAPSFVFQMAPGTPEQQVRSAAELARTEFMRLIDEARSRFAGAR